MIRPRNATRLAVITASLFLTGCAAYAPRPLSAGSDGIQTPDTRDLAQAAPSLRRPYLAPTTIDLSQPLDDNAIATIAVLANPDLKSLRERARVTDAQAFSAGLLPDPTFSLGVDKVLSGPDTQLNIASALGLDLNALRARGVLRAQAEAQAQQTRLDLAWSEWQTAGQARIQAVRIIGLQKTARLDAISRDTQQASFSTLLRAAGRGDISADQLQAARIGLVDATDKAATSERNLAAAQLELTRLLGLAPETPLGLAGSPLPDAPPDAGRLVAIALAHRSDLEALRRGYSAQEATLRKAVMDQFPTLNLTVNVNRDSADNFLLGPAVDFTLPLWNRNRGGIAVESATRDALKAEYDARLFQTRAEIVASVSGIRIAMRQRAALVAQLPEVEAFAQKTERAAARGDLAVATAVAARQSARDKEAQVAQGEQDIRELSIGLELLTGVPREEWTH